MMKYTFAVCLVIVLLMFPVFMLMNSPAIVSGAQSSNTLSDHWIPSLKCYRDELDSSQIDYNNCWTDNAGKILSMASITGDATAAGNALSSLELLGLSKTSYYLPEVLVNSTISGSQSGGVSTVNNGIVQISGSNLTSVLTSLSIGNYYAGSTTMGYLGSDRILVAGKIYRSESSTVFQIANGLSKRSLFVTTSGDFYLYLNATLKAGMPYANVSMQVLPLNTSLNSGDLLYLQVFSSSGQFDNASLYTTSGSFQRLLAYNSGSPFMQNGLIVPYSEKYSVFDQDSVAVSFNNATSNVDDFEHWYQDGPFDGLSWIGIAYYPPANKVGAMSEPIYTKAYPLQHLDYHLVNETASYISSNPKNVALTPPVGFGFVSYGLALDAALNPQNTTLANLARGYWNYYYSRYNDSVYYTPYARSINLLALAGFKLYGCNATVESFARRFIGNTSGGSIEEFGWGTAALYELKTCTGSPSDTSLYDSFVNSFGTSKSNFIILNYQSRLDLNPQFTFQFGEAATGLMLGGVPYNDPVVLSAMNAVFQSNRSGTVLNTPYNGILANTETLPAYMLSVWLFQKEMSNQTSLWITGLDDANITSIDYANGTLLIGLRGNNGSITVEGPSSQTSTFGDINGYAVLQIETSTPSTVTTTTTLTSVSTTVSTETTTYTTTTTVSATTQSGQQNLAYIEIGLLVLLIIMIGFLLVRKRSP